jgi:membrane protein DedA with SNARE-associated domain
MSGWPFWLVVVALYVIVMCRSHATYWLGRAVSAGARLGTERRVGPRRWLRLLDRIDAWSASPQARRGTALVHRWGPLGVAVTYLTVGLHTAVLVAAGLVRMPYLRFTVASLFGSAAWAVVWSTVGLGAVWAVTRSWWGVAALVVVGLVVGFVVRRRRRTRAQDASEAQDVVGRSTAVP